MISLIIALFGIIISLSFIVYSILRKKNEPFFYPLVIFAFFFMLISFKSACIYADRIDRHLEIEKNKKELKNVILNLIKG
jgi:hypothetical protein